MMMNRNEAMVGSAEIFASRARNLAKSEIKSQERDIFETCAIVRCGGEQFGIPVSGLREIIKLPHISILPGLPVYFLGIVHVRGELITVVDLAHWLSIENSSHNHLMAVIENGSNGLGLAIEQVIGFREISQNDISKHFNGEGTEHRAMQAITKDLVAIIDLKRIFSDARIVFDCFA